VFLESSGRNRTPDKLSADERDSLTEPCDRALCEAIALLEPAHVIGVGVWATRRARAALGAGDLRVGTVLHPSPASPKANRGWASQAEKDLRRMGIEL
jgi:single-strand selective monofunctional uracil DNA glycosylase